MGCMCIVYFPVTNVTNLFGSFWNLISILILKFWKIYALVMWTFITNFWYRSYMPAVNVMTSWEVPGVGGRESELFTVAATFDWQGRCWYAPSCRCQYYVQELRQKKLESGEQRSIVFKSVWWLLLSSYPAVSIMETRGGRWPEEMKSVDNWCGFGMYLWWLWNGC